MEKEKKYNWIGGSLLIIGTIVGISIFNSPIKNQPTFQELQKNDYKNEISGRVSYVHIMRGITLRLKGKVDHPYHFGFARNNKMSPPEFEDFVLRGDSVYKAPNTDSLYVIRGDKRHLFVLDKTIN